MSTNAVYTDTGADKAPKEWLDVLIRNDIRSFFPPCTMKAVMEGIRVEDLQPILRLGGIFITEENAEQAQVEFAYLRFFRGLMFTRTALQEASKMIALTERSSTEAWPFPSFLGKRCTIEESRKNGVFDPPKTNHFNIIRDAMKKVHEKEDAEASELLVAIAKKDEDYDIRRCGIEGRQPWTR